MLYCRRRAGGGKNPSQIFYESRKSLRGKVSVKNEEFGCKSMAGKQLLSMNLAWGDWQGPLRRGFGLMGSGA